ncbi:MAG: hypothetical protein EA369_05620 [Bradymonadales bacterium]|nr:MAG: hypothetical protein EA369_05620 [Bradymonadales bacterium]
MQKILDKLNKVPVLFKVIGLVVVILGILAYYQFGKWSEISAKVASLQEERSRLERQFEDRQRVADDLSTFQENTRRLEEDLRVALRQLPREREIPQLLRDIYTLGNQSGITFRSFEPGNPQTRNLYSELPLRLQITGGYHEVAVFFDRVGKMNRIVNISNIELGGASTPAARGDREVLNVNATATTFMFTGGQ